MSRFSHLMYDVSPSKTQKTWSYTPSSSGRVLAPHDGKISKVNTSNGSLIILHPMGFKTKITGIDNIQVGNGDEVEKQDILGLRKSGKVVNLEILDSYGIPQVIAPFFAGTAFGLYNTSDNKKSEKTNIKNTKTKKKEFNPKTYSSTYDEEKKFDPAAPSFLDIALAPLHLLGAGWKYMTKKKEDENEENLTEEIQRIKELLK